MITPTATEENSQTDALCRAAKYGEWKNFESILANVSSVEVINTISARRSFGTLHQIAYWGSINALNTLIQQFGSEVNLDLLTREESPRSMVQVATDRGHRQFAAHLMKLMLSRAV